VLQQLVLLFNRFDYGVADHPAIMIWNAKQDQMNFRQTDELFVDVS
jgi:hypothetical protein